VDSEVEQRKATHYLPPPAAPNTVAGVLAAFAHGALQGCEPVDSAEQWEARS
jgi:hypothetical protein